MAISKSADPHNKWRAEALAFSGRPNPEWAVSEAEAGRLMQLWDSMKPATNSAVSIATLGYRGCALKGSENQEWLANRGVVSLRKSGTVIESRGDPERDFERLLLLSAPEGLIPPGLADFT
jgi:hypothetical protein